MGSGIAQVFAQHGYSTILYDVNREVLHKAQSTITGNLQHLVTRNKLTAEQKAAVLQRIRFAADINDCRADLIIEAVIEKADVKSGLLKKLISLNSNTTIFATNTSSLPVSLIGNEIATPGTFLGMHFFNPAPVMKLVEIVVTEKTNPETVSRVSDIVRSLDKTPVVCSDSPGFIVNRVARPYYLEALYLAEKGISEPKSIDRLTEATGFRMGPFALMDLIGNDINYSVSCIVYEALGKPARLAPSALQEQKVKAGSLGRKTGKGYYEYPVR
jgi:3-hydroxybutyryl-CoA dehydrogenase